MDLALEALEQALYGGVVDWPLIHFSDRGGQYLSIAHSKRLAVAGIESSVGSRGDSHDNALAETLVRLIRSEVINHHGR